MSQIQNNYGLEWAPEAEQIDVEMEMIRRGGYVERGGKKCGLGLFHHYKALISLLWPWVEHHRWSDMILKGYCEERYTIVQGPKDCSKTFTWSMIVLADYWTFPQETLWLVSSTDMRGLELRLWGSIKELFNSARNRYPWLAGHISESKKGIFTDEILPGGEARDIRKGLICIPCTGSKGEWVGIEKFVGIKQKRRRLLGDELQFMKSPYLVSVEHLDKGDFKMGGSGNPIGQGDPLDKLGEPRGGWGTEPQTTKTETWRNRYDGITICLDGRDTPNNDPATKDKFEFLLCQADIDRTVRRHGQNSSITWTQVYGKRKAGLIFNRVLTREMCERNRAFRECVWEGAFTTIYACDAAFGGDRAIGGAIDFGREVGGKIVIRVRQPRTIEIVPGIELTPEEQLARAVKADCDQLGIPDSNVFFDAGMYATAATNLSKIVGVNVNAVNFQGSATSRPCGTGEKIRDPKTGETRLKRCDEAYKKFVTELWWFVRLATERGQITELPEEVANEFFLREFRTLAGNVYELETKPEMKLRVGFSPDLADWLSIGMEGARRLGFEIDLSPDADTKDKAPDDWLEKAAEKYRTSMQRRELNYN